MGAFAHPGGCGAPGPPRVLTRPQDDERAGQGERQAAQHLVKGGAFSRVSTRQHACLHARMRARAHALTHTHTHTHTYTHAYAHTHMYACRAPLSLCCASAAMCWPTMGKARCRSPTTCARPSCQICRWATCARMCVTVCSECKLRTGAS
eukprot:scaffold132930_cov21-Tisochrysis_lutea.AAC.1